MAEGGSTGDEISMPALLRAARTAYGAAIRRDLAAAGFDDIPKNGIFVIGAISRRGAPMARIIEALGMSKQAAGQLIDQLVLRGYLLREVDPQDRRRLTISLSERGAAAAKISRAAVDRIDAALTRQAGDAAVAQARTVLTALIAMTGKGENP